MKNLRRLGNLGRFTIGASLAASLFACSALIGLTDPTTDNSIGADGSVGSDVTTTTDGPNTQSDGGGSDAAVACDAAGIATDPLNCGSCGHSCLGGTCANKQCQPVLVVQDETNTSPYDLSIDGDTLFFTNGNPRAVRSIDKNALQKGIGATTLLTALTPLTPYEIATSGSMLLFAVYGSTDNGGKIEECTTTSCTSPLTITNLDSYAVATDGTALVYGKKFTPEDGGDPVYTVMKSTVTLGPSTELMQFPSEVFWLKIYKGVVYVGVDSFDAPGGVYSCPLTGCALNPTQISTSQADEIYVVNDTVFYTDATNLLTDKLNTVRSVGISGSNPVTLASALQNPLGVVADSNYVYFSDTGDIDNGDPGKLLRCPVSGCGTNNSLAVDFNQNGGNPQGLVDDGNAIYWGDYNGRIYKLAK